MELRQRTLPLILLLVAGAAVPAFLTPTAAATTPSGPIAFIDESAAWNWRVTCADALLAWVKGHPNPVRPFRVSLTDEQNLGPATVGRTVSDSLEQLAVRHVDGLYPSFAEVTFNVATLRRRRNSAT